MVDKKRCEGVEKMPKKPSVGVFERRPKNDKIQLHVELTRSQYRKFQAALKKLGYRTISEQVRENVRRVIAEAELTAQDDEGQV